jgi:hypothetical protein
MTKYILDFTNKNNKLLFKNGKDLCELLKFIHVENISYMNIQTNKRMIKHFIKYKDDIYYMDYFGLQFDICSNNNNLENINTIIGNTNYKEINVKKGLILYNITSSAGHELCFLLCGIYHLNNLNLLDDYTIIVSKSVLLLGTFIKSVLLLFFKENQIIFLDEKTIVNIEESIIYTPPHYKIKEHNDMLIEKLNIYKDINIKYDNVCMIKSVIDGENVNSPNSLFKKCYLDLFKENNFEIISPNNCDVITLFNIINNCKNIVLSWGCNAWINSIFVDKNTNVLILCHIDYKREYFNPNFTYTKDKLTLCTPICNKLNMEFDLPSELNNDIKIRLKNVLDIYTSNENI